jgi:hypothetical protein
MDKLPFLRLLHGPTGPKSVPKRETVTSQKPNQESRCLAADITFLSGSSSTQKQPLPNEKSIGEFFPGTYVLCKCKKGEKRY